LFLNFDRGLFEVYGPTFFVGYFKKISNIFSLLQTGFIYHYVLFQVVFLLLFTVVIILPLSGPSAELFTNFQGLVIFFTFSLGNVFLNKLQDEDYRNINFKT